MTLRCPRCRSPIHNEWGMCPTCGRSQPSSRDRIRCRSCGAWADNIYHVCPTCGADLEAARFPLWLLGRYLKIVGSAVFVAGIVFGAMRVRPSVERGANQVVAFFMPTPTPTMTATGTATVTPTQTNTPTTTPTSTPIPTPTATPTATSTESVAPSPVLPSTTTPTPTVSPTPTPRFLAPVLVEPPEDKIFIGSDQLIVLSWESVGPLAADEWYAVRLSWSEQGVFGQRGGNNLKETSWRIPADFYWGKADQETGRAYEWYVYVEQVTQTEDGQRVGKPVSPASETRTLYWQ
jgi:hypothetical protein